MVLQSLRLRRFVLSAFDCPDFVVAVLDCRLARGSAWGTSSCSDDGLPLAQNLWTLWRIDWFRLLKNVSLRWYSSWTCLQRRALIQTDCAYSTAISLPSCLKVLIASQDWDVICLAVYDSKSKPLASPHDVVQPLDMLSLTWRDMCPHWGQLHPIYSWRSVKPHSGPFVDLPAVARHLEGWYDAEYANRVRTVDVMHFVLQVPWSFLQLVLPIRHCSSGVCLKLIAAVIDGCMTGFLDQCDDCHTYAFNERQDLWRRLEIQW